jgi:hypothetical protein
MIESVGSSAAVDVKPKAAPSASPASAARAGAASSGGGGSGAGVGSGAGAGAGAGTSAVEGAGTALTADGAGGGAGTGGAGASAGSLIVGLDPVGPPELSKRDEEQRRELLVQLQDQTKELEPLELELAQVWGQNHPLPHPLPFNRPALPA